MDAAKLQKIIEHSAQRMNDPEFNQKVEQRAMNESMSYRTSQVIRPQQQQSAPVVNNTNYDITKDGKVPQTLMEQIMANTAPLNETSGQESIISSMSMPKVQYSQPVQQSSYVPQSQGIDYSLLKTIIDESVKRNLQEAMNGGLLTESSTPKLAGFKFASGNKIQFLDAKGNLFEGTLVLKKKAKQK